jgi:hypothetical protein
MNIKFAKKDLKKYCDSDVVIVTMLSREISPG